MKVHYMAELGYIYPQFSLRSVMSNTKSKAVKAVEVF